MSDSRAQKKLPSLATIGVQLAVARRGVPRADKLKLWAQRALLEGGVSSAAPQLCIRIVGNRESQALNRRWRGKDKPTNVLSFPSSEINKKNQQRVSANYVLGDLVVCAPVVAQEARAQGKPADAHWAHMIVHGILHLLGYDHEKSRDAVQMEAREIKILRGLGFANPYLGHS